MPNPALLRYIHQKVLEAQDRARRGVLDPDKIMTAVSAVSPDKSCLYVLVNETKLGIQSAALFKSTGPGHVVYDENEVREEARGSKDFIARATVFAREHTQGAAVQRKYPHPGQEEKPK